MAAQPGPSAAPAAALAARLRRLAARLMGAATATRHDPTAANVHRLRLATRRVEGALALAGAVLGPAPVARLEHRLQRPFRRAGRVRDRQVAVALLRSRRPADPSALLLADDLEAELDRPLHGLHKALRRRRRRDLGEGLAAVAAALERRHDTVPARRRAAAAIHARLAVLAADARDAAGTASGEPGAAPTLHRARVRLKRLRYALTAADGLAGIDTGRETARLRRIQQRLGAAADLGMLLTRVAGLDAPAPADGAPGATLADRLAQDHAVACGQARAALAGWIAAAAIRLDTPGPAR
jgi:CHAD domain-containing protein